MKNTEPKNHCSLVWNFFRSHFVSYNALECFQLDEGKSFAFFQWNSMTIFHKLSVTRNSAQSQNIWRPHKRKAKQFQCDRNADDIKNEKDSDELARQKKKLGEPQISWCDSWRHYMKRSCLNHANRSTAWVPAFSFLLTAISWCGKLWKGEFPEISFTSSLVLFLNNSAFI